MATTFEQELEVLINRFSRENESGTPDFILAEYLEKCLENYGYAVRRREAWYSNRPANKP